MLLNKKKLVAAALVVFSSGTVAMPTMSPGSIMTSYGQGPTADVVFDPTKQHVSHAEREATIIEATKQQVKRNENCAPDTSSCRPPAWATCSDEEKSCLLGNACAYASCLKAGFCLMC